MIIQKIRLNFKVIVIDATEENKNFENMGIGLRKGVGAEDSQEPSMHRTGKSWKSIKEDKKQNLRQEAQVIIGKAKIKR